MLSRGPAWGMRAQKEAQQARSRAMTWSKSAAKADPTGPTGPRTRPWAKRWGFGGPARWHASGAQPSGVGGSPKRGRAR